MNKLFATGMALLCLFSSNAWSADNEFPGRKEYKDVAVIELSSLASNFDNYLIVDTRSNYEFETIHISGAVHIPLANKDFEQQLKDLPNPAKKQIVFYCNGRSCYKSYVASRKAALVGIKNTLAFDAGVFEWAQNHPQYTALLGKSPIEPSSIISNANYRSRLLNAKNFTIQARAADKNSSAIIDIRDKDQRAGVGFFPGKERWISMDDHTQLRSFLADAAKNNKTLYIYDEVGKQTRWLQYALEDAQIKNYYFMKDGARGFYEEMIY